MPELANAELTNLFASGESAEALGPWGGPPDLTP